LTEQRRAPTPLSELPTLPEPTSLPPTSRSHQEDPPLSPTSSSDESSVLEVSRHPKRVRTPTPPLPTQSMFEDGSDTDSGTISPIHYRSRFEAPETEKTAALYEKRTSNPQGGNNPRKLKTAPPPVLSEIAFSPIMEVPPLGPPTHSLSSTSCGATGSQREPHASACGLGIVLHSETSPYKTITI
jgi:hypothetical protein